MELKLVPKHRAIRGEEKTAEIAACVSSLDEVMPYHNVLTPLVVVAITLMIGHFVKLKPDGLQFTPIEYQDPLDLLSQAREIRT